MLRTPLSDTAARRRLETLRRAHDGTGTMSRHDAKSTSPPCRLGAERSAARRRTRPGRPCARARGWTRRCRHCVARDPALANGGAVGSGVVVGFAIWAWLQPARPESRLLATLRLLPAPTFARDLTGRPAFGFVATGLVF